jgi:cell division protein FtsI (penicillin-binding protein 3)
MKSLLRRTKLHMTGSRSGALDIARGRLVILSALFALVYIVLAVRAFDLSILQGQFQDRQSLADHQQRSVQPEKDTAFRRDIIDRNGVLLARSIPATSLYADPKLISDPEKVAQDLVKIFPQMTYGEVLQKLQEDNRFTWISRHITPDQQQAVLYLGQPGLGFQEGRSRIYPQGALGAHVLGYTNIDGRGLAGLEAAFDNMLEERKADLQLSLDVRVQHAVREALYKAIRKHKAIGGAGVVMDVHTGEVLAAVSLPDFDPHHAGQEQDKQKFNRFSLGVYEPGSTFKIFSTAALLEMVNDSPNQFFDAREPIKVGRFTINDFHAEKRVLSLPEVFMHSSNIGSSLMGQKVGTEKLKSFYEDLGLIHDLKSELPERGAPLVPSPWREVNTLTASFGHGIAVTPLQLTAAASSVVNGGMAVKPTFIKRHAVQNKEQIRIISSQTAHRMRQLLRLVVTKGTGSKAEVRGFEVGGKTGTAEKPSARGGYDRDRLVSSFLGVFPMRAPQYAVYIMVDEPKGIKETHGFATGGWVAAPAVAEIVERMASVLGLTPLEDDEDISASLHQYVKSKEQIARERKAHLASY